MAPQRSTSNAESADPGLSVGTALRVTAEEAVTTELRRAIREGLLVPGQRLTQSAIARQLGVSRIPLRDALRRLEVESLVKIDGHKGARVTELTADAVAEIYEMRIMLEPRCMTYAVENMSIDTAEKLSAVVAEMCSTRTDAARFGSRLAMASARSLWACSALSRSLRR